MKLMPMVYVSNLARAIRFYEALGLGFKNRSRNGNWAELELGGAVLALHQSDTLPPADSPARVALCFEATRPLEHLVTSLSRAGYPPASPILDEAFGRSLVLQDPDGLRIQINDHDHALYT